MHKFNGSLRLVYTVSRRPDGDATFFDARQCAIREAVRLGLFEIYRWRILGKRFVMDRIYNVDGRCVWRAEEKKNDDSQ